MLASSCSFVTLDIKEFLIRLLTDRIRADWSDRGIQSEWEADALICSVNLEVEVTGCALFFFFFATVQPEKKADIFIK